MSKYQLKTYIVKFENGAYFNGVKGKEVAKTKHFKDAKRIDSGKLNDRDLSYLVCDYLGEPRIERTY